MAPEGKTVEGYANFEVATAGKQCQTWYTYSGDLKSNEHTPVVVLHGGPGKPIDYLRRFLLLNERFNIPVILYDQLGNGRSTHLPEKNGDGSFWNEELFMNELDNLLTHLGIQENYDLIGHSWGGMLASRHAVKHPAGLRRLILYSAPSSMPVWDEAQWDLRLTLPKDVQETLQKHEDEGTKDSEEYQKAVGVFLSRHLCRINPMPEDLLNTEKWEDQTVTRTMYGDDEFRTTGTLKHWTILDELHLIQNPTLVLNGRYDLAQDKVVSPQFWKIPKAKWFQFAESSHMAHLEETDRVMEVVASFLTR